MRYGLLFIFLFLWYRCSKELDISYIIIFLMLEVKSVGLSVVIL